MEEFIFCPKCGGDLNTENKNLSVCQSCSFQFYKNPKPSSGAIIETEEGKIVLIRREKEPKKGYLDYPGGFIDLDETAEEAAIRELKEEVGIEGVELEYFGSYPSVYINQEINFSTIGLIFCGRLKDKSSLIDGDEVTEVVLVNKDNIPWEKIAFPGSVAALKDYIKR